ncbi:hypothetical protein [Micromonospora sp. NPDC004551]|uniref:hypothetical protein n=1 Tax=Micromonospora sp. NPDC004551 TaxID=3154284 RepID=UPI0033B37D36
MSTTPAGPAATRPMNRGTRIGFLAPSIAASSGSHSAPRGGIVVDDVVDTAAAVLHRRDRGLGGVSDVHGRPHRAAAHDRELAFADHLQMLGAGGRPDCISQAAEQPSRVHRSMSCPS